MDIHNAREQLRGKLRDYVELITRESQGTNMYVCPLCGSGTGPNGTGAFSVKGEKWKCFSCEKGGDIFDLIRESERITDHVEQVKWAGKKFGANTGSQKEINPKTKQQAHTNVRQPQANEAAPQAETIDYTTFFLEANQNIGKTNYRRGISLETLNRFQIGFVEKWRHPKAPESTPETPRLIIPTSDSSYLARDVRDISEIPENEKRYTKSKVGSLHFFNIDALETATKPIFVVEGELDALSIIEVGGEAIALGTASTVNAFIKLVITKKPVQQLIVAMDNDQAGEKAAEKLLQGLKENKVSVCKYNPYGEYKDANEALEKNREALTMSVSEAENILDCENQEKLLEISDHFESVRLQNFVNGIAESVNTPQIPTGFQQLDQVLDGGVHEGLYIIGAISSLGKTTFALQMCDQIAKSGKKVLIFSLEMSANELIAKSISRHTLEIALDSNINARNAKTAMGITIGSRYVNYSPVEKELIENSIKAHEEYAKNICIYEGDEDMGVTQIREIIKNFICLIGKKPVVVVDYIQILEPSNIRATDKQNMDKAVRELKRISRDFKIPVIGISSFNRASYNAPVTMEAFKESGALEYGSDVLIGLQFKGVGEPGFDVNFAKESNPRGVELVVLKNRNGATGKQIYFNYYPMFNFFKEYNDCEDATERI